MIKKNISGIKKYPKGSKEFKRHIIGIKKIIPGNSYPHQPLSAPLSPHCAPIALIANSDANANASVSGLLLHICRPVCIHMWMYACTHVCMYVCICLYACR